MQRPTYETRGDEAAESLIDALFALGGVGYVAIGRGGAILMRAAPGLVTKTSEETNFFEELLVNPTLLGLASRRGGIDCDGLSYIAVGYGGFTQLILNMHGGHISLGVARNADTRALAGRAHALLAERGLAAA